jgi:hypothetical protein
MYLVNKKLKSGLADLMALGIIILPFSLQGQDGVTGAAPDLIVNSIDVTPSAWMLGEAINIIAGVRNDGSDNSNATTVDFFLSSDSTISIDDQLIGSDNVIPLLPTEFWAAELSGVFQPDPGVYWIGACVQPDGLELDTSNNCSQGFEVTVTANTNACVDLPIGCGGLLQTGLSANDCDQSPIGRGHFAKSHSFEALLGATVIVDTAWSGDGFLYLEDPSGVVVAENDDGDDIFSSRIEFTLTSSGSWKIWATTFDALDEMTYEIGLQCAGEPAPDLVVELPVVSSTELTTGGSFSISATVKNQGNATSKSTLIVYLLSDTPTISVEDALLGFAAVASLNGGDTSPEQFAANAPDVHGTYWIGACVDAVAGESAISNNCSEGVEITVQRGATIPINAGMNDAWFNMATDGQGFFFNVFPNLEQMFVGWFTYDVERPDDAVMANIGEPGHRWLTALGDYSITKGTLSNFQAEGGVFNSSVPVVTQVEDGSFTVDFTDCRNGLVAFDIPSINQQGEIPITRISNDNVPLCEELAGINQSGALRELNISAAQVELGDSFTVSWITAGASDCTPAFGIDGWDEAQIDAAGGSLMLDAVSTGLHIFDLSCSGEGETVTKRNRLLVTDPQTEPVFQINEGLNDAWFNPDTAGQGFFINVFPGLRLMFLSWFTYDTERPDESVPSELGDPGQRWFTALGEIDGNRAVLKLDNTSGGIFNASPPTPVSTGDGTIVVEFDDCNSGTVDFRINSADLDGEIPIERITLDNVPLCEMLSGAQ